MGHVIEVLSTGCRFALIWAMTCQNRAAAHTIIILVFWPHWFIVTIFGHTLFIIANNVTIITIYTIYGIVAIYIIYKFFAISFSRSAYYVYWGCAIEFNWACKSQNIKKTIERNMLNFYGSWIPTAIFFKNSIQTGCFSFFFFNFSEATWALR